MRILIILLLLCTTAYAEQSINLKLGVTDVLCEGVDAHPSTELTYEYRHDWYGIEAGVGGATTILHDTQVETEYVGKAMGRLNTLNYFITPKLYYNDFYCGAGIGYLDTFFSENYKVYPRSIQADVDDEIEYHALFGWQFVKDWFIEYKHRWCDLDIESNVGRGILEARSNLNSYTVMVGRKWRF